MVDAAIGELARRPPRRMIAGNRILLMGSFHYTLEIAPRHFLGEPAPASIALAQIQKGLNPWREPPYPSDTFLEKLRRLLPLDRSWGETEEYVSSDEASSDLRIWYCDGIVGNIEFRYNPNSDGWLLMQEFLAAVDAEGYLLIERRTGAVLAPDENALKARLRPVHEASG